MNNDSGGGDEKNQEPFLQDLPFGDGAGCHSLPLEIKPNKPTTPELIPAKKTGRGNESLLNFLKSELTRGYSLELDEERLAARREKVYTFIKVPGELERLMGYGFFQCADAFLFVFTFLPLRCIIAFSKSVLKIFQFIIRNRLTMSGIKGSLKPADKCDLLKFFILCTCVYFFSYIDTSVIYHVIKSQSVIKLYIFFNMLEVGDKLFASFVQDTLDALFLTATEVSEKKSRMGTTAHTLLAVLSVFGHAGVLLLQGTTLSVAINASNRALLTVMMSNNFVELKGAVFKKFDKMNLFQISCSDVRERFHLSVLLLIVSIQTMREYSWEESRFWILFPDCLMVMLAEVGVDWLKHAFITRFNEIHPEVYREYTLSMAYDLVQTKQRRAFSDHSDMIGRRLGFVPLPLAVVLARVIRPSLKGMTASNLILIGVGYIALASFRLLNSIILLGKACDLIDQHGHKTSPQHTQAQPEFAATKTVQELQEESLLRFRNAASQPTTRTPSPSRGNQYGGVNDSDLRDRDNEMLSQRNDDTPRINSFPGKIKRKSDAKVAFRSYSASHTPRPSIVGETSGLASLGEAPDLPSASTALLMANSAVSILSVSLNEEMLRANSKGEKSGCAADGSETSSKDHAEDSSTPLGRHARKHSLGSNVEHEFTFQSATVDEDKENFSFDPFDPPPAETGIADEGRHSRQDMAESDMDVTLVSHSEDEIAVEKENTAPPAEAAGETEGSTKKHKKKGLAWLLGN